MKRQIIALCIVFVLIAVFVVPVFAAPLNSSNSTKPAIADINAEACQMAEGNNHSVNTPRVVLIPAPIWKEY